MDVVLDDTLGQLERHQSVAAECSDVCSTDRQHLGEETVHEAIQTTLLTHRHEINK